MSASWFIVLAGAGCCATAFVWYWLGVGRAEDRFAADFDAVLRAYSALKMDRDRIARLNADLVARVGVLSPEERAAFDQITFRLEHS